MEDAARDHVIRHPLQWGHGREAMDGASSASASRRAASFNGAMAVRPWMGATPAQDAEPQRASMGPWP